MIELQASQRLWFKCFAVLIALSVFPSSAVRAEGNWVTLKNCHYLPNAANDGDSFHVDSGGKEYIFRLYFVDAPETDTSIAERVREQAKYFGITEAQALMVGQSAKLFSKDKLSRPFTVRTCMEDARGRSELPRFFAFIETATGDLAEQLVSNGMARVYGASSTPPGGASIGTSWKKLEDLERKAKAEKVGGWGASSGRLTTRSKSSGGPGSFDTFFHTEPAAGDKAGASSNKKPAAPSQSKLNVNKASVEELQAVPGIGPALAQRIVAARPFASADDLRRVKGIGAVVYEKVRPYFE